ncbi:radical SAM protein [Candidatus Bathyarchaeota archaeon]|nr:radical SAM protein [Candidatus Bathyarchaeota archaeon]
MHITLINPPSPSGAPSSRFIPLGLGYLAAYLETNQFEVSVIDYQTNKIPENNLAEELSENQPKIVGVTTSTLTYRSTIEIVKIIKKILPSCCIILGGPHVTVLDKQTLEESPEVDIVVRGEGEETLLEIAVALSSMKNGKIDKIKGITFRKQKQIIRNKNRPFIDDLDDLPHPAFHQFNLNKYSIAGKRYLPIITSRGCPFQCTFCLASQMCGTVFRTRSAKKVVEELEWLRDEHKADIFAFYDDTFTFNMNRAFKICKEIKNIGLDLPWDCRTRVDRINPRILAKMREAGCELIHFGVESGSQKMLNLMKKGTTVEQNAKGIKMAKDSGIAVAISVVVGYPGETVDLLKETFNFIRKTEPDYVYVCQAIPYPGTQMYDELKNLGWEISNNWNQYDEQTSVFENPLLSSEQIEKMRGKFYDEFFSPKYFLRKTIKKDFYSRTMAHAALNHLLWRIKLPKRIFTGFRKLYPKREEI